MIACDHYFHLAIASAQTILFLLQEKQNAAQDSSTIFYQCTMEAKVFREHLLSVDISSEGTVLSALDSCIQIHNSFQETLRVTAHAIGAIRKVVSGSGWNVKVSGVDGGTTIFHVPRGSYVGVSHYLPNVDVSRFSCCSYCNQDIILINCFCH